MTREDERAEALMALQRLPDPPDLVGCDGRPRGYRYTLGRDPLRDPDVIKRELGTGYVERRRHELGKDISRVVSKRTFTRLKLVSNG